MFLAASAQRAGRWHRATMEPERALSFRYRYINDPHWPSWCACVCVVVGCGGGLTLNNAISIIHMVTACSTLEVILFDLNLPPPPPQKFKQMSLNLLQFNIEFVIFTWSSPRGL